MIKKHILLLLLLSSHFISFGQEKLSKELDSLEPTSIKENVIELRKQGVDTIYTYYHYCAGCDTAHETEECDGFLRANIVWRMNGKTFSRQVDCKNSEYVTEESTSNALGYFIKHFKQITHRPPLQKQSKGEKTVVYMPYRGPVHHVGEQFHLIMGDKVYSSFLTEYLRDNVEKTNLEWVKATMKLADINKKEIYK